MFAQRIALLGTLASFSIFSPLAIAASPGDAALPARTLIIDAIKGSYGSACVDVSSRNPSGASVVLDRISKANGLALDCTETSTSISFTKEVAEKGSSGFICSKTQAGVTTSLGFAAGSADPSSQFVSLANDGASPTGLYCSASTNFEKLRSLRLYVALGSIIQQANLPYSCGGLGAGASAPSPSTYSFDGKNLSLFGKSFALESNLNSERFLSNASTSSLSLSFNGGETLTLHLGRDGKNVGLITIASGTSMVSCLPKKAK
ncbi:hypothetical protein RF679_00660 [Undibacterium cyanobacteriorum]|uniref:Uncharacterized protein n=1 Tax=Undibacterium cyanobacteriorum TaxID=3073561 RepID=A0ABY9RIN7_9BURK|nr:hypothetical protein [Undibacterium sp. 20NA77.5]WMW80806.1 hypothetical protein RF679_00660 [Undibacterium sp. 20NA77.5]